MSSSIEQLVDRQVLLWRLRQAALTKKLRMRRLQAEARRAAAIAALETPPKSGVRHAVPRTPTGAALEDDQSAARRAVRAKAG